MMPLVRNRSFKIHVFLHGDLLQKLAAMVLAGREGKEPDQQEAAAQREPVIQPLSLEGIANRVREISKKEEKNKILVMTGAGISTAAGIPDFRSPGTGLYDNLQKYNLPEPTAVFQLDYFRENPNPFFLLAKELYPGNFKPTMSHYFIRLLAEKGLLLRNFTQNIDTLERRAGIDPELLMEAHGSFSDAHCIDCSKPFPHSFVKDKVFSDDIPRCDACKGLVKPDIVFFGEALPERFATLAGKDTRACELLIVMGTSLVVHPFASVADRVPDDVPRLLLNREKVHEKSDDFFAMLMGGGSGFDFSEKTGYRDVFHPGDCDSSVLDLARLLGWEDELKALYADCHARLDAEMKGEKTEKEDHVPAKKVSSSSEQSSAQDRLGEKEKAPE